MSDRRKAACCYNCRFCRKPFYLEDVLYCTKAEERLMLASALAQPMPPIERVNPDDVCDDWEER